MHVPWDDAGCLCPVGDFFNYAAPAEEPCGNKTLGSCGNGFSMQTEGLSEANAQRLTDAGFEDDVGAYCFYAKRNYREKEQVWLQVLVYHDVFPSDMYMCLLLYYLMIFTPLCGLNIHF